MIYGIGTDIVQIARIQSAFARNGDRFAEKILGDDEFAIYRIRKTQSDVRAIRFLATRFAAKEAFSKALGTGMRAPMQWRAMQTVNAENGQPQLATSGALHILMQREQLSARVSLSDEADYALAFVIIEKADDRPNPEAR